MEFPIGRRSLLFSLSIIFMFIIPVFATSIQTGAYSGINNKIISESYDIKVPPYPIICCQSAYEFHAGITNQNALMKTTMSYGCQIDFTIPCSKPYINRYSFYVSVINLKSFCNGSYCRTQYPSNGYTLTPNSSYSISMKQVVSCSYQLYPAWLVSITNSTSTYSITICGITKYVIGQQYTVALSGSIETHDLNSCYYSPVKSFTQSNFIVNNYPIVSWSPKISSTICNFKLSFSYNNITLSW